MTANLNALRKPVVAVHRAVQILHFLGSVDGPAGVHEIARALDIVPSTCLHILRSLAHEGMVTVDPRSKRYGLGPTVLQLAQTMVGTNDFIRAVQPVLDRIAANHNITTAATWLDGKERVIVVAKSEVPSNVSITIRIGSRFPMLISAIGMCLAGNAKVPIADLSRHFDRLKWQNPPGYRRWLEDVGRAAERGYAVDAGYYIHGVTVLAAPVFDTGGGLNRFLVALGFSQQLEGAASTALAHDLQQAAASLSNRYAPLAAAS